KKCLFISCASYFNNPVVTSTFALLSFSIPFPATRSFGSSVAICTFFKSLSIIASAHDPVFPTCEQGSSVTYIRSEEHTSELQSRFDLVCRLLLEKKNK